MSKFSRPPSKPPAPEAPAAGHTAPCACTQLLKELQAIAQMMRLQLPHDGAIDLCTGRCKASTCWCASV